MNTIDLIEEETDSEIFLDPVKLATILKSEVDGLIEKVCDETVDRSDKAVIVDTPQMMHHFYRLLIVDELNEE